MSTEVFTVAQLVQIQIVETETGLAIFIYLVYFFIEIRSTCFLYL